MNSPKKIVVIGPESTGKSTLSEMLSRHFKMPYVKEYARAYIERLDRPYRQSDLLEIAEGQLRGEEAALRHGSPVIFCDTDLYVIKVWSEHKYNHCATTILQQIAKRSYDLYLLTSIDMPWQDDPQREHPDPVMRKYFYAQYHDIMLHAGVPWVPVSGNPEQRLQTAIAAIDQHLPAWRKD